MDVDFNVGRIQIFHGELFRERADEQSFNGIDRRNFVGKQGTFGFVTVLEENQA